MQVHKRFLVNNPDLPVMHRADFLLKSLPTPHPLGTVHGGKATTALIILGTPFSSRNRHRARS